jgi:hypothetical protein
MNFEFSMATRVRHKPTPFGIKKQQVTRPLQDVAVSKVPNTSQLTNLDVFELRESLQQYELILEQYEQQVRTQEETVKEWDREMEQICIREIEMRRCDVILEMKLFIAYMRSATFDE